MQAGIDYVGVGMVFACHDGNGKFLFARRAQGARDGHGLWEIPGGGLDRGETLEEGLVREIREEFGARPRKIEFMNHKEVLVRDGDVLLRHWIAFEFLVELDPSEVIIGEPDKCDAIEWRTLDDVPGTLHHGSAETIANVIAYQARMK
jgi:8-oxo-dGTP diphosphatase